MTLNGPSLKVIEDEKQIRRGEGALVRTFEQSGTSHVATNVGYPSGHISTEVLWHEQLGVWLASNKDDERFWNSFGTEDPTQAGSVAICCEINLPYSGINRRVGGALARDSKGRTYLVHRGRIGGGRKGVGAALFWNYFDGGRASMVDGNRETQVALIGDLESPRLMRQLQFFIKQVERIKLLRSESPGLVSKSGGLKIHDFAEEFHGERSYQINQKIVAEVDHGLIVQGLRDALVRRGYRVGNDRARDVYVHNGTRISSLFEVKPNADTTSLYTAIGQLSLHSLDLKPAPKRYAVLPAGQPNKLKGQLSRLRIEIIPFDWKDDQPVFPTLSKHRF